MDHYHSNNQQGAQQFNTGLTKIGILSFPTMHIDFPLQEHNPNICNFNLTSTTKKSMEHRIINLCPDSLTSNYDIPIPICKPYHIVHKKFESPEQTACA